MAAVADGAKACGSSNGGEQQMGGAGQGRLAGQVLIREMMEMAEAEAPILSA